MKPVYHHTPTLLEFAMCGDFAVKHANNSKQVPLL